MTAVATHPADRASAPQFTEAVKTADAAEQIQRGNGGDTTGFGGAKAVAPAEQGAPKTSGLSPRAQQICEFIAQGLSNKEIARKLGCVEATVKVWSKEAFRYAGVNNRTQLAMWWVSRGQFEPFNTGRNNPAVEWQGDVLDTLRKLVDSGVDMPVIRAAMSGVRGSDLADGFFVLLRERAPAHV